MDVNPGTARTSVGRRSSATRVASATHRATLGFLVRFLLGWGLSLGILAFVGPRLDSWAIAGTAASIRWLAELLPLGLASEGNMISLGRVMVTIIPECTPLYPTLLLSIAIVAYPATAGWKLAGVVAGAAALWIYNLLRVVGLIHLLASNRDLFLIAHTYVWGTMTLVVVSGLFVLWLALQRTVPSRNGLA